MLHMLKMKGSLMLKREGDAWCYAPPTHCRPLEESVVQPTVLLASADLMSRVPDIHFVLLLKSKASASLTGGVVLTQGMGAGCVKTAPVFRSLQTGYTAWFFGTLDPLPSSCIFNGPGSSSDGPPNCRICLSETEVH